MDDLCTLENLGSLGEQEVIAVIPICSNGKQQCARCGVLISDRNDSGWEVFIGDGRTTQPICKVCDQEDGLPAQKEES